MDYKEQQNRIKAYIQNNYPIAIESLNELKNLELQPIEAYIDDFLDLDLYGKSRQLFFNFGTYNYDYLSNDSEDEDFVFSIYLVFRKASVSTLRENMLDYATAFYKMFDDSGRNFGGIADYGKIETVQFYPAAEGHPGVKIAELTIRLHSETDC